MLMLDVEYDTHLLFCLSLTDVTGKFFRQKHSIMVPETRLDIQTCLRLFKRK